MKAWTLPDLQQRLDELDVAAGAPDDPRELTRQRILDVAADHFIRFGYRRARIADIAEDAGLGKGTPYLYFDSKKTLLLACIVREKRRLMPGMAAVMALPPAERLLAYLELTLGFVLTAPLSAALLRGEKELEALIAEVSPPKADEDRARGLAFLEGLVADARPGLDPAECAALAQLLTELVPLLAHRNGADPDAFAARLAALLAQGVAARP